MPFCNHRILQPYFKVPKYNNSINSIINCYATLEILLYCKYVKVLMLLNQIMYLYYCHTYSMFASQAFRRETRIR